MNFLDDNFAKPAAEVYTSIAPNFVEIGHVTIFLETINELDNTANQLLARSSHCLALNDFYKIY